MLKLFVIIACLGHIVCGITDCMLAYSKSGRFDFSDAKDPEKMRRVFSEMPLKQIELATLVGIFALFAAAPGYLSVDSSIFLNSREYMFYIIIVLHSFDSHTSWFLWCSGVVLYKAWKNG